MMTFYNKHSNFGSKSKQDNIDDRHKLILFCYIQQKSKYKKKLKQHCKGINNISNVAKISNVLTKTNSTLNKTDGFRTENEIKTLDLVEEMLFPNLSQDEQKYAKIFNKIGAIKHGQKIPVVLVENHNWDSQNLKNVWGCFPKIFGDVNCTIYILTKFFKNFSA